jgi:hypothetical protein
MVVVTAAQVSDQAGAKHVLARLKPQKRACETTDSDLGRRNNPEVKTL